jgi:tungstate transport system substrate-binding protein
VRLVKSSASIIALAGLLLGLGIGAAQAQGQNFIIVQSTTSTQNSGLFRYLRPIFEKKTGIQVRVVAVGTGQALKNSRNGDGDVVLVHARQAELKFLHEGWGVKRYDVMYNDFVLVGPAKDPAHIAGLADPIAALKKIAAAKAPFASRGDDSGTNKKELALWKQAGIDARTSSGSWYRETGSGMGATLNAAVGMSAYTLTDRGTWISFKNRRDFKILVQGSPELFNQYGVMLVNPKRHPRVKAKLGQKFIDWLIGPEGQKAIAGYKIDGQQLFFPNAKNGQR